MLDAPRDQVRAFDLSARGHATFRRSIRLTVPVRGSEFGCTGVCVKSGWLQPSRDGRYVYVGDSGDVIDARALRIVAHLPALEATRQSIEIDWRGGRPVAAGSRNGPVA